MSVMDDLQIGAGTPDIQGPCCSHLSVERRQESPNGGMTVTREWWECRDCGTEFHRHFEIVRLNARVVELCDLNYRNHMDAMIAHRFIETLVGEQARGRDFAVKVPMAEQQIASLKLDIGRSFMRGVESSFMEKELEIASLTERLAEVTRATESALQMARKEVLAMEHKPPCTDSSQWFNEGLASALDVLAALATRPTVEAQPAVCEECGGCGAKPTTGMIRSTCPACGGTGRKEQHETHK